MPMALLRVRALCCCWQTILDLHIHEGLKGLAPHIALQDLGPAFWHKSVPSGLLLAQRFPLLVLVLITASRTRGKCRQGTRLVHEVCQLRKPLPLDGILMTGWLEQGWTPCPGDQGAQ